MKIEKLPTVLAQARPILKQLDDAGYEAFFVGGSVRDTVLGNPIHDVDIASSAFPEEVKAIFQKTVDTGIQHGTVMVLDHGEGYEITTLRTESTYTDFRRPDQVTFVRSLSEDLKRRDFTINALALKEDGEIVDLFDGIADLQNGLIRAVGQPLERFNEDALRIMRAIRFSAQLNFEVERQTRRALAQLAPHLEKIAVERIQVEFEKMLMGPAAGKGLLLALDNQVTAHLPGGISTWDENSWQLILQDLYRCQATSRTTAWTALLSHSPVATSDLGKFLRTWKLSRDVIKTAQAVVPLVRQEVEPTIWHLYQVNEYQDELLETMRLIGIQDQTIERIGALFYNLPIRSAQELAINGGDLIRLQLAQPGPALGQLLANIEHRVVEGQLANTAAAITHYVSEAS